MSRKDLAHQGGFYISLASDRHVSERCRRKFPVLKSRRKTTWRGVVTCQERCPMYVTDICTTLSIY